MRLAETLTATMLAVAFVLTSPANGQDSDRKPADLFKQLDKNGDGTLAADEISEEQKRSFDRLVRVGDDNEDGKLSRSEFDKATSSNADRPASDLPQRDGARRPTGRSGGNLPTPEQMMSRLDRNKDGKLSKNELPEFLRQRFGRAFEALGKEELTVEDLAKLRRGLGRDGDRRPGGDRPQSDRRDSDRPRPESDRPDQRRSDGPQRSGQFRPAFVRILDRDEDGMLSKAELQNAPSLLERLDQNKDGKLAMNELFGGRPGSRDPRSSTAGRPDRPRSDRPATDRPATDRRRPDSTDRPTRPASDRPGGDRPAGDRPQTGRGNPEEGFRRLDRNGDGAISKEEAPARLKENFDRIDANKDGKVTVEELRQVLRRSGGSRPSGSRPGGNQPRGSRPQRDNDKSDSSDS